MSLTEIGAPRLERIEKRRPLAQLLHALNQPLTGLQCSMEVALAAPRTTEQYVRGLHEGLRLTERMRALVEAMREVVDLEEEKTEEARNKAPKNEKEKSEKDNSAETGTAEMNNLLRATVEDLAPVAAVRNVGLALDFFPASSSSSSLVAKLGRSRLASAIFRLLDSALSVAAGGTEMRMESGLEGDRAWIRIQWQRERPDSESSGFASSSAAISPSELGLLVAQAGFEHSGCEWTRERIQERETLTVRLPCVSVQTANP